MFTSFWRRACAVVAVLAATTAACSRQTNSYILDRLHPCASNEGPTDGYCGSLRVFENRAARTGRQIDLRIVVLPALGNDSRPDPLFFLAGGPGQGAAQMAGTIRNVFRPVQRSRDIVLVDQRGTGKSHPLECRGNTDSLASATESDDVALDRLRACLKSYDADVRLYTTPIAMDDLDDVREYLGYDAINLYGGSYGTRAALVYLRQHGGHVRSAVLDGVAPTDMKLPLFTARDAQGALDKMLTACAADEACHAAHPDLSARVKALMMRLDAAPPLVRLVHPRTGATEEIAMTGRVVSSILFGALYSPLTASMLPLLIERAERNDFQGLVALALAGDTDENMSVGMQLSVICSEDAPRITSDDLRRESDSTVFGAHLLEGQLKACAFWPKGTVDPSYYDAVKSDVPVLVLSGDADPVTPPTWGDEVAAHLSRARHFTAPATGHGVIGTPCGVRLIGQFLDRASADGLDVSCLKTITRPPFFLGPAGPDPSKPSAITVGPPKSTGGGGQ